MSRREIIILVVVGVVIATITGLFTAFITTRSPSDNITSKNILMVNSYILHYGTYIGTESEYDYETDKVTTKEKKLVLKKDKIINNDTTQNFIVKGNKLVVNGYEMYEVSGDNTLIMLAGEGVEFKYEK